MPVPPASAPSPTAQTADEALDALDPRARRCLAPDQRVALSGFFDGRSGRFLVENIASTTAPVRAQQCVVVAMERARVTPFAAGRYDARWTVSAGTSEPTVEAPTALTGDANAPVGEVDINAVMAQLRAEVTEAQRCYEDALRGRPSLSGRVEVRLSLSVDGRITHAVASGPVGFRPTGNCILGHLRRLLWPAARQAPVDVVFRYQFAPVGAGRLSP